jgi:hypothetical protein
MLQSPVSETKETAAANKQKSARMFATDPHPHVAGAVTFGYSTGAAGRGFSNRENRQLPAIAKAQSAYGNQAVLQMLSASRNPALVLQRKCDCDGSGGDCAKCNEKEETALQRRAGNGTEPNSVPPIVHEVLRSPGQPLDANTRAFMEPRFGHDFSQVRIHTGARPAASARAVNALAYTVGKDVVFGRGQYAPGTGAGKKLLAHELTHVVQQRDASMHIPHDLDRGFADPFERVADEHAEQIMSDAGSLKAASSEVPGLERLRQVELSRRSDFGYSAIGSESDPKFSSTSSSGNFGSTTPSPRGVLQRRPTPPIPTAEKETKPAPFRKSLSIVSWINPKGLPDFSKITIAFTPPSARPLVAVGMILKCTANSPPPRTLKDNDLAAFGGTKQYRAIQQYTVQSNPSSIVKNSSLQLTGFTAPSNCGCDDVPPCAFLPGESSPLNYVKSNPTDFDALMKFRVSEKEEAAAIKAKPNVPVSLGGLSLGMLNRVPWVWTHSTGKINEGSQKLSWTVRPSAFPTHTIYVDGEQVAEIPQQSPSTLLGSHIRTADKPRQTLKEEEAQSEIPLSAQEDTVRPGDSKSGTN